LSQLTGASSKVGWAVARALRDRYNYTVLCHSTDQSRRDLFTENGFVSASTLHEGTAFSRLWIVGKCDAAVAQYIPQGATAVVFSVPHPLHARKDVRVIEAGTLHMDLSRLDRPRRFTNKLQEHEIFACHAAGVVAAHRLRQNADGTAQRIDEIGPVEPDAMDSWLDDAKRLGFRIPVVCPVNTSSSVPHDISSLVGESPPVVIVGGGPAGLATAAAVRRRGVHAVVLEEQTDPCGFGSWDKHFSGLTITTQKRWCNLPGFAMDDRDFPGETIDATAYRRYLRMYAERFDISILRGHKVDQVVRGGETAPWIVKCGDNSFPASAVVVATGKNRIPRRDTSDKIGAKMLNCGIQVLHSTDLRSEEAWAQAIAAARVGKLCVVGFGNSASDLCSAILQSVRCSQGGGRKKASIHIAARNIPPVFPRSLGFLQVDTIGVFVRWFPSFVQEVATRLLWWGIPSSAACDAAFPAHLPRWNTFNGRVPVIDKFDEITSALRSGSAIGHGPVRNVSDKKELFFEDGAGTVGEPIEVDVVIMATGYEKECIFPREDRLNGMFLVGFGSDKFLPLKTIGEDAERIAQDIAQSEIRDRE
jgi:putative flavoprotein involved in K+ transport